MVVRLVLVCVALSFAAGAAVSPAVAAPAASAPAAKTAATKRATSPFPPPLRTEVAPGIYLFRTEPYGDVGLDGNSIAIVSNDGVLVFDSNGTPSAARAVLAQIRTITKQPVRYLVLSHWHWDHWYGAEVYKQAFPGIEIVAHTKTRALMAGPAMRFNQPGLDEQLPAHIRAVEEDLAKARAEKPGSDDVKQLEKHVALDQAFLAEKRGMTPTLATLTYDDSLTIHLGEREIHVLHHDRAITPGDTYLWLPKENVVVTGDLLINPITYALFCYPSGWISTLKAIDALDAATIVPGHGAVLRDETLLHDTIALLEREKEIASREKSAGHDVDVARKAVLADTKVLELRSRITGGDAQQDPAFGIYLVDWFVKRLYPEFEGTLDDLIPAHP
jgi:glyoxylase-like metal-dependent hydrolase (beta-lactamase superfamily II)